MPKAKLLNAAPKKTMIKEATSNKQTRSQVQSPMQNVVYWARLLETIYNRQFMAEMQPARTTISIWRILSCLNACDALTVGEISTRSHIERTVVSRLLDRMHVEGLIARAPNGSDRRIVETRLTPKGREQFQRMRPIRQKVYAKATRGIAPERLEGACQVIIDMIENLGGGEAIRAVRP